MSQTQYKFVHEVLELYLTIPDTPNRFSAHDCHIAKVWFDQGVSILQIQQAMLLAQIRRGYRRSTDPPLNPIRSLHYFAPILQELQRQPMDEKYFSYLQLKLKHLTKTKPDLNGTRPDSSGHG